MYDVLGKMIFSQKPANSVITATIDLSSVLKGVYLLEVTTTDNLEVYCSINFNKIIRERPSNFEGLSFLYQT